VWQESSHNIKTFPVYANGTNVPEPAIIEYVEPGSIGEDLGCEPGDQLLSVNGIKPRDLIDYKLLIVEEILDLEILGKEGTLHKINIEKEPDEGLGLVFTEALFDGLKQCNNKCSFCFIDQQPTGQRKSLYLKDDDYRMSFLYGSYLTLTNLNKNDWFRIENQRLSPLFVSVHATEPSIRRKLLKNPSAGLILEQIKWFSKRNLQIHAQIVVCPRINDGSTLEKTLKDLFLYSQGEFPTILSAAVVPVGLTKFRPENDGLLAIDKEYAKIIISQVEELQEQFKAINKSRFAWLSDEWYLIAGKYLPSRDEYENLPQEENGVGSIRSFLEKLNKASEQLPKSILKPRKCSWVVGKLVEEAFHPFLKRINTIEGLSLKLYGLPSNYWGQDQVVTGLLTGQDLIEGLKDKDLGEMLLLPSVMLKQGEPLFLDSMSINDVSKSLDIAISVVNSANEVVQKAIGEKNVY